MANNIPVTPGSGATMATLDISGVHHPKNVITDSAGNDIVGLNSAAAWDLAAANTTLMALLRKQALLLEDVRAAVANGSAVSLVKDLDNNAREQVSVTLPGYTTASAAETMMTGWSYTVDGVALVSSSAEYTVPAGKRFRITSITGFLSVQSGHTTSGGVVIPIRWNTGAVSPSTAPIMFLGASYGTLATSMVPLNPIGFSAGGFELAAGVRIGASVLMNSTWASGTNQPKIWLNITGHLYDDTP